RFDCDWSSDVCSSDLRIKNDQIFGTQALADFNMYHLLGIRNAPQSTDWFGSLDYLSKRGAAAGTMFRYSGSDLFGRNGNAFGIRSEERRVGKEGGCWC